MEIDKCENVECKGNKKPEKILRLISMGGQLQNPLRFGNRTPAKIVVCTTCEGFLCNESSLRWASEGDYKGNLNATGSLQLHWGIESKMAKQHILKEEYTIEHCLLLKSLCNKVLNKYSFTTDIHNPTKNMCSICMNRYEPKGVKEV